MERRVFPIVHCTDLLATRRFYVEVFGAQQVYGFPPDGDPVYVSLAVGDGQVALGVGTTPAMYGETPLPATGHAVDVCLYVADLDAAVAAAERLGAPVPVRPVETPWGERVAYLRDPEGTMLLVIQAEEEGDGAA
ncbi:glyoxalase/bleomycin resistance/extradiol dioxygenase family protein [Naasia sp. SYSU D00948]|uniref:VOC family protein n=1 Tax=Naasia sp. SYSU D00948 TaxID=2817379 RepID=UPI001B310F26|nr:VOC family protein [Naasia sp. SYSU D00948]